PEMNVGFFDVVGIQGVSLSGERKWWNRSVGNVLRLASGSLENGERVLLATHELGNIARINAKGDSLSPLSLSNGFAFAIFSDALTNGTDGNLLALVRPNAGSDMAVGLEASGSVKWT